MSVRCGIGAVEHDDEGRVVTVVSGACWWVFGMPGSSRRGLLINSSDSGYEGSREWALTCCLCKCRVATVVSGQASRDIEQHEYDTLAHYFRKAPLHVQQP